MLRREEAETTYAATGTQLQNYSFSSSFIGWRSSVISSFSCWDPLLPLIVNLGFLHQPPQLSYSWPCLSVEILLGIRRDFGSNWFCYSKNSGRAEGGMRSWRGENGKMSSQIVMHLSGPPRRLSASRLSRFQSPVSSEFYWDRVWHFWRINSVPLIQRHDKSV